MSSEHLTAAVAQSDNSPFSAISDKVDGGETTFNLTRSWWRFVLQIRARGL